jgi:hypothetical protein
LSHQLPFIARGISFSSAGSRDLHEFRQGGGGPAGDRADDSPVLFVEAGGHGDAGGEPGGMRRGIAEDKNDFAGSGVEFIFRQGPPHAGVDRFGVVSSAVRGDSVQEMGHLLDVAGKRYSLDDIFVVVVTVGTEADSSLGDQADQGGGDSFDLAADLINFSSHAPGAIEDDDDIESISAEGLDQAIPTAAGPTAAGDGHVELEPLLATAAGGGGGDSQKFGGRVGEGGRGRFDQLEQFFGGGRFGGLFGDFRAEFQVLLFGQSFTGKLSDQDFLAISSETLAAVGPERENQNERGVEGDGSQSGDGAFPPGGDGGRRLIGSFGFWLGGWGEEDFVLAMGAVSPFAEIFHGDVEGLLAVCTAKFHGVMSPSLPATGLPVTAPRSSSPPLHSNEPPRPKANK